MTWHDLIREGRERQKLSQAKLAKRIGVSQALIGKLELAQVQRSEHLGAIIDALALRREDFPPEAFEGAGRQSQRQVQTQSSVPLPDFARDPAYWAAAAGLVGDVPLYASAEGGEGALLIEREPIGSVRRPPLLQGVKDGYAIFLVGDSMTPEFEPGDTLMINPRLPVLAGTSCVFYSASSEEPKALVKRFLSATENEWRVRQYNPAQDFSLGRDEWTTRHRIVAKNFR